MPRPIGRRRVDTAEGLAKTSWLLLLPTLLVVAPVRADDADPDAPTRAAPVVPVGDVSVTATRAERDVLDTAGNVTVIDREAIERSSASSVAELLRREAGLYVANTTTSRAGYVVEPRGFNNGSGGGSSLLVLVDGRRVNEAESSVPAWELIQLDQIERIEIVRGPASALYGDNATGGVIEIVTRTGEGPAEGTLTGRLGEHRTKEGSLFAGGSAGPVSLALFADHFQSDGYREQSDFRIDFFQGRADVALGERASLSIRGGYSSDDRRPPGPLSNAEIEDDRRQVDPDSLDSKSLVRNRFVDGVVRATPLDGLELSLQGYYTRRSDHSIAPSSIGDFFRDFETEAIGVNTKAQIDAQILGLDTRTLLGVDLLREDRDGNDVFASISFSDTERRTRRKVLGAWLQEELQLTSWLLLSAGIRHDRAEYRIVDIDNVFDTKSVFEPTHAIWSPRVSAVARVNEAFSVYVSFSRGFRFPNLEETSGVVFGNPEIEPQRSRAWEIGWKHRSRRIRANVTLYRMDVKDEIIQNSEIGFFGGPGVRGANVDRVRHKGVETSWSVDVVSWLELHGGYTWDDTRILRDDVTDLDGKRVPITPRHRANLGLLSRLPWGLEAGLDVLFVGRRWGVNDFGHDFDMLDPFRRWDLHVGWRPRLGEHVELGLTFDVQNLMNRRYEEWGGRRTFVAEEAFFPSPERLYVGGLSITVRQ
jgi:iron complex outermembrane receptor protein